MNYPGEIRISCHRGGITFDFDGVIGAESTESDGMERPVEDAGSEKSAKATFAGFRRLLEGVNLAPGVEVKINIRSVGGAVGEALLIYDHLRELVQEGARITTLCHGYTASAATIIAQAASPGKRLIAPGALYLIHNSTAAVEGNCLDARHAAELLDKTDARIAAIYAVCSGRPEEVFTELMGRGGGRGEWLTPEEAMEAGLADGVAEGGSMLLAFREKVRNFFSRKWLPNVTGAGPGGRTGVPGAAGVNVRAQRATEVETLAEKVVCLQRRTVWLAGENLRLQARPSATLPREDPDPMPFAGLGDTPMEGNRNAYDGDVQLFREGR